MASNRKEDRNRIANFWKLELPLLMYETRFKLLYAFLFFFGACLLGWISAANDDSFVRLIMGDSYVNQTLENIKNGDPLAIYGHAGQADMFLQITFNNIKVSFVAFVLGILFSFLFKAPFKQDIPNRKIIDLYRLTGYAILY